MNYLAIKRIAVKTIAIYTVLFTGVTLLSMGCRKDDVNPPDTRFPLPLLTIDTTADLYIPGLDPESFVGKFVVDMYYGQAVTPQKVDVVVKKNDDRSNIKIIRAGVTSFPASIQVTGTQLRTLFDSTIKLGDKFEIGVDVTTKEGKKFEAFPATGKPYGADTAALPGSRFSIVYTAECKFDVASFNGYYTVQRTTHEYWAGDSMLVAQGPGNTILVTAWPYPNHWSTWDFWRIPMIVKIDPVTLTATVDLQTVGEYCCGGPLVIVEGGSGTVSQCGDSITLNVTVAEVTDFSNSWYECILELKK